MTNRKNNHYTYIIANCDCNNVTDKSVQPNLSITPRDVQKLTERGIAVSTQNNARIVDNDTPHNVLPLEYRRNVDINTVWEKSHLMKQSLINQHKQNKYGKLETNS